MSKSQPSTTTVQNSNPQGAQQGQYLQNMWQGAQDLANPGGQPQGLPFLGGIMDTAMQNYNQAGPMSSYLVPQAYNSVYGMLGGNYNQGNYAAGPQIGQLGGYAPQAINAGNAYAGQIAGAANQAPGTVAPWQAGLGGVANQFMGMSPYGQQSYGNINALAPQATSVANPAQAGLYANAGMAVPGNPIYNSLMGMANGQYLNPQSNPALAGVIQSATQPLVNQYQTATAPQIASQSEAAGRYGSGVMQNAQNQAQYNLGQGIGTAASNITSQNYLQGLNAMLGAGSALGSAYNTGIGNANTALANAGQLGQAGVGLAGTLYGQGANAYSNIMGTGLGGAANAYNQGGNLGLGGLNAMIGGLNQAGGTANAGYSTGMGGLTQAGNLANTGQLNLGGIAQMTPDLANFPLSSLSTGYNALWAPLQNMAGILGPPIGGNTTQTQTSQNYSSIPNQVLSGLTGIASLAKMI